ncbi:hypothetical protein C8R47DRAFT_1064413 [Mycena vitilis]|nr:hypothetical protein C8R47DRAFT_1064413 [Mycena vitilis]
MAGQVNRIQRLGNGIRPELLYPGIAEIFRFVLVADYSCVVETRVARDRGKYRYRRECLALYPYRPDQQMFSYYTPDTEQRQDEERRSRRSSISLGGRLQSVPQVLYRPIGSPAELSTKLGVISVHRRSKRDVNGTTASDPIKHRLFFLPPRRRHGPHQVLTRHNPVRNFKGGSQADRAQAFARHRGSHFYREVDLNSYASATSFSSAVGLNPELCGGFALPRLREAPLWNSTGAFHSRVSLLTSLKSMARLEHLAVDLHNWQGHFAVGVLFGKRLLFCDDLFSSPPSAATYTLYPADGRPMRATVSHPTAESRGPAEFTLSLEA